MGLIATTSLTCPKCIHRKASQCQQKTFQHRKIWKNAVKTALGWTVNGPLRDHTNTDLENCWHSQATVNHISVENVEQLLLQQYNQDFPERLCDDKVEKSQEDQKFINCVRDSIYHADGHYVIGLPKKKAVVAIPNNHSLQYKERLHWRGSSRRILSSIKSTVTSWREWLIRVMPSESHETS